MTKLHRELWSRYDERPELHGLLDRSRDIGTHPLADEEVRFANFLFLHINGSYRAGKAGIYVQPDRVRDDIRDVFSYPAFRAAWDSVKAFHDRAFIAFIESCLAE